MADTATKSKSTTVALADETIAQVDGLRKRAGLRMLESEGYEIQPSRTDIVRALVSKAHNEAEKSAA